MVFVILCIFVVVVRVSYSYADNSTSVEGSIKKAVATELALSPEATTKVASPQKVSPLKVKKEGAKRKHKDLPSTSSSSTKKPKRETSDSDFVEEED
jgi:hypothetical protein